MPSRLGLLVSLLWLPALAAPATLILHNGKVLTLDSRFSTAQAVAVDGSHILATGSSRDILARFRGPSTEVIDLKGKTVLPGLGDAHVHALEAGLSEFRAPLPPLNSIAGIQDFIRVKARSTPKGEWIVVPRTLPPRLAEMRMPTRQDLDVDTDHPVAFDGSYVWSANSLALQISGITRDTPNPPGGEVVKGPDGEPVGILRNASQLLKNVTRAAPFTEEEKLAALELMLRRYRAIGLTSVGDRLVTPPEVALFEKLKAQGRLPLRVVLTWRIDASRPVDQVVEEIRRSSWVPNQGDDMLRIGTFKITLDGGQSVGTAYQRMPYGPFGRQLYGIMNPDARGTLFVDPEKLYAIFSEAYRKGWQLTAHVQGGAAIDTLIDVFERLDKIKPIRDSRSHVMHGSFQSQESLDRMQRLGIVEDYQPAWLHLDAPALQQVFGLRNMRWFSPTKAYFDRNIPVAGGSDHMIGHDPDTAVNPFNPFFNIWMCLSRQTSKGQIVYPEERPTRRQAIEMYTSGPAYLQFAEKTRGSIESGKLADFTVIETDILNCPVDEIRRIRPAMVFLDGRQVEPPLSRSWQSLFDGKTPKGWLEVTGKPFPETWTIEDGSLKTRVVEGGYQDIRTQDAFLNFDLEFDWKIAPGANSGVKYFVEKTDEWKPRAGPGMHARARGAEYQLIDDSSPDAKTPANRTGALYGKIAPASSPANPPGQWNHARILAHHGAVEHWLNGKLLLRYAQAPRESFLSLQNHHGDAWFRNLRVRRLDP